MNPAGSHIRFRSLYRHSAPGSRINEDGLGLNGHCAWIIDGATGLANHPLTTGASDAAWLSGVISNALGEFTTGEGAVEPILSRLELHVCSAFHAATTDRPATDDHHAPSACLGLVSARDAGSGRIALEGWFLGDVVALVPTVDGVMRWTDERAKPFEQKTLATLGAKGHEPGRIPEAARRQILENRASLNRPDGYWVVNPRRPWAGHELRFEATLEPENPVVLATDGFMRLVDVFGVYSDEGLLAELSAGRGDELMQQLRDLERGDLMADRYPRVKTHDDASILVIAAER